jgi:hypothetical protein
MRGVTLFGVIGYRCEEASRCNSLSVQPVQTQSDVSVDQRNMSLSLLKAQEGFGGGTTGVKRTVPLFCFSELLVHSDIHIESSPVHSLDTRGVRGEELGGGGVSLTAAAFDEAAVARAA